MNEASRRRHVREKAVIDHLSEKMFTRRTPAAEEAAPQGSQTETGLPVEGQVRKEWNPKKGGLPIFLLR